jgi:hypothetical protein
MSFINDSNQTGSLVEYFGGTDAEEITVSSGEKEVSILSVSGVSRTLVKGIETDSL